MANCLMSAELHNSTAQISPTVYIADSDLDVSKSIEFLLATEGIEAAVFDDGVSLLDAVRGCEPSCVVLAALLSDMSGVLLMKRLQKVVADLPVIILANTSDVPSAVDAVKSGAWDYLEKPFIQRVLLDSVRRAIN
jgi:two-component system, LuxR family, response regulator FixJ